MLALLVYTHSNLYVLYLAITEQLTITQVTWNMDPPIHLY